MRISDWSSDVCSSDLGVILQETKALRAAQQDVLAQSRLLLSVLQSSLEDDKADDIVVIELADKYSIADFMVIASGRSARHVGAIAEHLCEQLKAKGVPGPPSAGMDSSHWGFPTSGAVI